MKTYLLLILLAYSSISLAQSDAADFEATVASHYFDYSLKLVKETPGFSPPVAARAFAYMGLTLYEAMVPGMPGYSSTSGVLNELENLISADPDAEYHWPTVANNAMAFITDSLFKPMSQANRDSLIAIKEFYNTLYQSQLGAQIYLASKEFGELIGRDIFNYSRTDGGHECYAYNFPNDYVPPVGEDLWVPFGSQIALQPYWGDHRPFIKEDTIMAALLPPPPSFSVEPGSPFYNYANQVYTTGLNLTSHETETALYWADGGGTVTPAGHSISILENLLTETNANLETAALAYAKLGLAVSDAFLACWRGKFIYDLCRPVTYIRQHIDSTWLPLIATPPFPEYPSGHSSQSGAMAVTMTDVFGEDYTFTDMTHGNNFGGPRTFSSFDEAAQEAAISRLYGGIHFEFGNMAGMALGNQIGNNVVNLFRQLNVATEDMNPIADIHIYPNPTYDMVSIRKDINSTGTAFALLDMFGKTISQGILQDEITSLDIRGLTPGIYLLRMDDHSQTYKIVKN